MPENNTPNGRQRPARDRRDPFVVDLLDVLGRGRRPGISGSLRRAVPAPAGLGWDLAGVPTGSPLVLDLQLQSVTEGVLVTGTVRADWADECARCLEPVSGEVAVDLVELFAYPDSATERTTDEDDVHRIVDDLLDVETVVRDAVVLGTPRTPLCRPDCAGLCPDCGARLDDLPAGHTHDRIDPRFAALAERFAASTGTGTDPTVQEQ